MGKIMEKFCIICGQKIIGKYSNEKRKTCGNFECQKTYQYRCIIAQTKLNPKLYNQKVKISNYKLRKRVLVRYSGSIPKCSCCGETEYRFLTLDHINGEGKKHRDSIKKNGGGIFLYRWLFKQNFPEGFQILCMNCNFAKNRHKKQFCPVHHPELYDDLTLFRDWYSIIGYKSI